MQIPISRTDPIAQALSNSAELCATTRDSIRTTWVMVAESREAIRRSQEAVRRADRLLSKSAR
jgi:hypothetical protein